MVHKQTIKQTHAVYKQGYPQRMSKDDLKLIKYVYYKVKLNILSWILSPNGLFIDMTTQETNLKLQRINI